MGDDDDPKRDIAVTGLASLSSAAAGVAVAHHIGGPDGVLAGATITAYGGEIAKAILERALGRRPNDGRLQAVIDRVGQLESEQRGLGQQFAEFIADTSDAMPGASIEFLAELTRQVGGGGLDPATLPEGFREATLTNVRRSLDAVDHRVLRPLARLTVAFSAAPLDRRFRSISRLLVDLDGAELDMLVALVEDAGARRPERMPARGPQPMVLQRAGRVLGSDDEQSWFQEGVCWDGWPHDERHDVVHFMPTRGGLIASLLSSGACQEPLPVETSRWLEDEQRMEKHEDRRLLEVPIDVLNILLDALSQEALPEPRTPTAPSYGRGSTPLGGRRARPKS